MMHFSIYTKHNLDLNIQTPHDFKIHDIQEANIPSRSPHTSSYSERTTCVVSDKRAYKLEMPIGEDTI